MILKERHKNATNCDTNILKYTGINMVNDWISAGKEKTNHVVEELCTVVVGEAFYYHVG